MLRSYLGQQNETDIEGFSENELKDGILDRHELKSNIIQFFNRFSKDLPHGFEEELDTKLKGGLESIPSSDKCKNIASNTPKLIWAGIFGRFQVRNEAIRQELNFELGDHINEESTSDSMPSNLLHSETLTLTDPSQLGILNYLKKNKHLVIQGPPGTGKSESITGIILNALEHRKKCLVVCEKRTAMEVLKDNLTEIDPQIGELVAVVEDVSRDRKKLVNSVRDRYDQYGGVNFSQPESLNIVTTLELIEEQIEVIQERKKFFHEKEFIDGQTPRGWTAGVGSKLLYKKDNIDRELFNQLKEIELPDEAQFNKGENSVESLEQAAKKLKGSNQLSFVGSKKVLESEYSDLLNEIESVFIKDYESLHEFCKRLKDEYQKIEKRLENRYENSLAEAKGLLEDLKRELRVLKEVKAFSKEGYWKKVLGIIAPQKSNLGKQVRSFDDSLKVIEEIEALRIELDRDYKQEYPRSINEIENYYSNTVEAFKKLEKDKITTIKEELDFIYRREYLSESLSSDLKKSLSNWMTPVSLFVEKFPMSAKIELKRFTDIIEVITWVHEANRKFEKVKAESFINHFEWQKSFYGLPKYLQRLISALSSAEIDGWKSYFGEWFYYHVLRSELDISLSGGFESQLNILRNKKKTIQKQIKERIPKIWKAEQAKLDNLNIPQLYNKRGSRGKRRNSLRKIAKRSFDSLTAYFPVMMVSPNVCSSMFELKPELFDYVIFDEASQLKIEESLTVLVRGERKIISGDSNQMPPSYWFTAAADGQDDIDEDEYDPYNSWEESLKTDEGSRDLADSESLLEFAELCKFESYKLDFHYRSHHPLLVEFSNAAFYKNRLQPLPQRIENSPIQFIRVDGLYEDQSNKDEANIVVETLRRIDRDTEGDYPSIGVATFNQKQKELILNGLKREAQLDEAFRVKYLELQEEGLFVKNLENIQGDERDIIILSTTFGKDSEGKFVKKYGPINRPGLGQRLLNVIVTRAKKKIFVLTSIPEDAINDYRVELNNSGSDRGYLHAYLAYASAVSDKDKDRIDSILKSLSEDQANQSFEFGLTESPFEEAVYQSLIRKIDADRVTLQHKAGGFRIDIAIKSKITGKEYLAIECDGATYHGSTEAYLWDLHRQEILENHGFIFHRIWSRDFWENEEREIKKLVNFIAKQDEKDNGRIAKKDPSIANIKLKTSFEQIDSGKGQEQKSQELFDDIIGEKDESGASDIIQEYPEPIILKERPVVEIGKKITVLDLNLNKEFSLKFAKGKSDSKVSGGVHIVGEKSPIGEAMIGAKKGETIEMSNLEKYYKVIDINGE